jgi:DinB superfamily
VASATRIQQLIQSYAAGPDRLETAVRDISEDEMRFTPGPEHWSIHENVVHLADAEIVHAARIRYVIAEPNATLTAFDQTRWARALDYHLQSRPGALALFRAIIDSTAEVLRRAPGEAWEHVGLHTEAGRLTLEQLVEEYADHVPYHLRTIAKRRDQFARARRAR